MPRNECRSRGTQARIPHLPPRGRDLRGRHPPGPGDPRGERGHARASRGAVRARSHQLARGDRADRGPGAHVRLPGAGEARGRQRHRARRRSPAAGPGGLQRFRRARPGGGRDIAHARAGNPRDRSGHRRHRNPARREQRIERAAAGRRLRVAPRARGPEVRLKGHIPMEPGPAPEKIGNYEVVRELGRGESATIYLGRELFPVREVAIKLYDPRNMSAETRKIFQSLFLKETLLARRLKHPNICQVYDAAADDQRTYIVMEFAKEGNLDRFCTRDTLLPAERVAHILERCCDALSYANANGVIHRDLKPANILMAGDGEAKVADFGVAFSNLSFDTTRSMVVGSPAYMAPEQLEGKPASMKSDMYAMGIVLYKMLVGALPFTAPTAVELAKRIVAGGVPPPRGSRPVLAADLDRVLARAPGGQPQHPLGTREGVPGPLPGDYQPVGHPQLHEA